MFLDDAVAKLQNSMPLRTCRGLETQTLSTSWYNIGRSLTVHVQCHGSMNWQFKQVAVFSLQ